ncbi:hypothetical protein ACD591_00880 [Rufibacter glacialis]|uniref:Uncharacterized protein n=1 Tax=Rufibacter glacialis TaxID=1259555 RepID=A0A5M8QKD3_9BACT|nr:hypothetical protein [Rufibacter glacialis]KAA6435460.1 hypothetical protein FOE74_05790 [Rufibacter glacialis]GGK63622.1 hypothetical protein GCM10011405_09590 [Rufibacter glacialis]
MQNEALPTITLVVYYRSTQPIATLPARSHDPALARLRECLEVIPCGQYYCLRLLDAREFRQARVLFPAIGNASRHHRFRGRLRKKAAKRPTTAPAQAFPLETYAPAPPLAARTPSGTSFRLDWIKAIFQVTLNGL